MNRFDQTSRRFPISWYIIDIFYQNNDFNLPRNTYLGYAKIKNLSNFINKNYKSRLAEDTANNANQSFCFSSTITPSVVLNKPIVTAFNSHYSEDLQSPTSKVQYPKGNYFLSLSLVAGP